MRCYSLDLGSGMTARASFTREPSPEDLAAARDVARAAVRHEEERRAALPPEERVAEEAAHAEAGARLEALLGRVRRRRGAD